jgi:hypothetical protein
MSTSFWLRKPGYRRLLAILEGKVANCVKNINSTNTMRYPIKWPDGSILEGSNKILNGQNYSFEELAEGRYVLGANELFIFQALDEILKFLAVSMKDPAPLYALVEQLENELGDLAAKPIHELELSVRATQALETAGITTVRQLCDCSAEKLLEFRNFGQTSLEEVRLKLTCLGLNLRGEQQTQ